MSALDLQWWFEEVKLFSLLQPLSFSRSKLTDLQHQIFQTKQAFVVCCYYLNRLFDDIVGVVRFVKAQAKRKRTLQLQLCQFSNLRLRAATN